MKKNTNNIERNQITINALENGHIFNVHIEINQKPKPRLSLFKNKITSVVQGIKKIIGWLKLL